MILELLICENGPDIINKIKYVLTPSIILKIRHDNIGKIFGTHEAQNAVKSWKNYDKWNPKNKIT